MEVFSSDDVPITNYANGKCANGIVLQQLHGIDEGSSHGEDGKRSTMEAWRKKKKK